MSIIPLRYSDYTLTGSVSESPYIECSYREPDLVMNELRPDKALQIFLHKHQRTARKVSSIPVTGSIIIHMFIESLAVAAWTTSEI